MIFAMNLWESWIEARLNQGCHRQLVLISGDQPWSYETAAQVCKRYGQKHLWLGDSDFFTARGFPVKQAHKCLGNECDIAVYDGHNAFHASAFLAVSGSVKRHGLLLLCIPPLDEWANHHARSENRFVSHGRHLTTSLFITHWLEKLACAEDVAIIRQAIFPDAAHLPLALVDKKTTAQDVTFSDQFATQDQHSVYTNIISGADLNHVITARRGRGKSALLGKLATFYTQQSRRVVVCTSLKTGSETLLKHFEGDTALFDWYPPDHPQLQTEMDILIIDELANLPIGVSLSVIKHAKQFLLATTVEGYEGTGRSFATRFLPALNSQYPELQHHHLNHPIRFYPNDVLEQHLTSTFMLQPPTQTLVKEWNADWQWNIEWLDKTKLIQHPRFSDMIAILTVAHYKTTPEDIMRIVDMPGTYLFVGFIQDMPVAAAVVIEEGGNGLCEFAAEISSGSRRVKGHLLAQSAALLMSDAQCAVKQYWRINRIAVLPNWQGKGLGKRLFTEIERHAMASSMDFIGAAFGTSDKLMRFWLKRQCGVIRMGNKLDAASGEVSATVLKPINRDAYQIYQELTGLYVDESQEFNFNSLKTSTTTIYKRRIMDYVNGQRSYYHMGYAIKWWLFYACPSKQHQLAKLLILKWINDNTDEQIILQQRIPRQKGSSRKIIAGIFITILANNTKLKKAPYGAFS